jgi:hypothetical protein
VIRAAMTTWAARHGGARLSGGGLLTRALALIAAASILLGAPALAKSNPLTCPAPNPTPIAPNVVHGIVSRVEINPKIGRGMVFTVHPSLAGLDFAPWMRNLERAGVNIAELYLQPDDRLSPAGLISRSDWAAYVEAALMPYRERTSAQQSAYLAVRNAIAAHNGVHDVTPEQQRQLLLGFLERLESLKRAGQICGNVQFVVVERRWFSTDEPLVRQSASEIVYSVTLANLVNQVVASGLGHWLAGFLLAEHTNTNMNQLLPIAVDLAIRINSLTRYWLTSHLMLLAGGGFGDQFNGINRVTCPATAGQADSGYQFRCRPGQPLDFLGLIARQTGTFAFAYKLFNWRTAPTSLSFCLAYVAGCERGRVSAAVWLDYLNDDARGLGFGDLATLVNENASRYPSAANVIFIGDATDSIYKMTRVVPGLGGDLLVPRPSLTALSSLFRQAAQYGGGWYGRLFMDAYSYQERRFDAQHLSIDDGSSLFYVDYSPFNFMGSGRVSENIQSRGYWRAWPALSSARP